MRNADSIKSKLRNLSVQEGKPYEYVQTHYMIERLLYRLSRSRFSDDFILKGGLLLHALFENRARATRDIDFLARSINNEPELLKAAFREICQLEADDAVTFDASTIQTEEITEDADYSGIRIKLVGYLDRSRSTLQFDIGFGDAIVPKPMDMVYPSLLGMDETHLLVYSKESLIAEKFQAMVYLAQANSRMKDFYDIYMLATAFGFDGAILREAIYQTLTRRGTPLSEEPIIFTENFASYPGKAAQWQGFSKRIHIESLSLAEVLSMLRTFLLPVYVAILHEKDLLLTWYHASAEWR